MARFLQKLEMPEQANCFDLSAFPIVHFQVPGTRPFKNLDFTRQTTDITHFAIVFHYDVISI